MTSIENFYQHYITNNKSLLTNLCLCLDCLSEYHVSKICDWCDNGNTAICPYCWDDTVCLSPSETNLYSLDDVMYFHITMHPNSTKQIVYRDDDTKSFMHG
jgi:hypothetical protein